MHDSPTAVFIIKLKQHKNCTFCENQLKRKAIASGDKGLDRNWLGFVLIKTNDHASGRQNRHSRPNQYGRSGITSVFPIQYSSKQTKEQRRKYIKHELGTDSCNFLI